MYQAADLPPFWNGHYLERVRCPGGLPALGSDQERERLLVGIAVTTKGQPTRVGITQRVAHRGTAERPAFAKRTGGKDYVEVIHGVHVRAGRGDGFSSS